MYPADRATDEKADALRAGDERSRRFFELGLIGMAITSPSKGILVVNDEICRILGYARGELLQMTWAELTHPDDLAADVANFDRVMAGEIDGYAIDKRWIRKDGLVIDGAISVKCARDTDGSVEYFVALLQDITERRRAEDALRRAQHEADQRVEMILDSVADSVFCFGADWRYTYMNRHARDQIRLLGKDPAAMIGAVVWDEFPDAPNEATFRRAMSERIALTDELFYPPLQEWVENRVYPSGDGGLLTLQRYVTERKQMELELRRSDSERGHAENERARLLRSLITAQEEERRRISHEMHDQFGQQLSLLMMKIAALKHDCGDQIALCDQVDSLEAIAKQLDSDVDFLVWNLRPTSLDDLGLSVALSGLVANWATHVGIRAELHTSGMEKDRPSGDIETVLYRVLQEALTNIAKHSEAGNVSVLLERHADHVSLIVEDDGKGFETAQAWGGRDRGLGLIGMRERAALVGGRVEIESRPGQGTTIVVRVPFAQSPA